MFTASPTARRATKWRAFGVVFSLVATLLVAATSLAPQAALADSGEAPYGTPTQALQSAISLGPDYSCIISSGNVLCWGNNSFFQLGNNPPFALGDNSAASKSKTPVYVKNPDGSNLSGVIGLATGTQHACALLNTTKVKCWGYIANNLTGTSASYQNEGLKTAHFVKDVFPSSATQAQVDALSPITGIVGLKASTYGTCLLKNTGRVVCFGDNGLGHEGNNNGYVLQCSDETQNAVCGTTNSLPIENVKQINQAGQTVCATQSDDRMLCWGQDNGNFANASYDTGSSLYPKRVGSGANGIKALSAGTATICGLYQTGSNPIATQGGTIKCWGQNSIGGELGTGSFQGNAQYTPTAFGITDAIAISGEERGYCALLITTKVKCWGSITNPNTGEPAFLQVRNATNTANVDIEGVAAVSVGTFHLCLIMQLRGEVRCQGTNTSGQIGDGTFSQAVTPINVSPGEKVNSDGGTSLTGAGADVMPPQYSSSAVNTAGSKVILSYEEPIASGGVIPTSLFTVKVNGVTKTISSVTVNEQTVELNMAERILQGDTVRMEYRDATVGVDNSNVIEDASFIDAASIPEGPITNNANTEAVAPTLVSAAVTAETGGTAGTKMTLTFNEALGSTTALPSAFTVGVASGSARTVSTAVVSGSTVVLTFTPAVQRTDTVTVAYAAPTPSSLETSNTAVQDAAGNDAASFSATTATNNSTYDTIAPSFVSAAMNGARTKMILTYSETLLASGPPAANRFSYKVTKGGVTNTYTPSATVVVSGSTVEVTLLTTPSAAVVAAGDTVTFTYTDPSVSNDAAAIQDSAGNDAITISTYTAVSNEDDTTAPVLQSGAVNSTGTSLTLTYSEALNATTAPGSTFTVTVGGSSRTVSEAIVSGSTVVLTLASAVGQGQTVTVAYAAPASSALTTNNAVQDTSGNDAVSFTSSAITVTNSSTVDQTAPVLQSGAVNTAGTTLTLTYNEALGSTTAAASTFTVNVGGSARTVSGVAVLGSTVVLTLASAVQQGEAVTVAYAAPTSSALTTNNAIQDSLGNDAISFSSSALVVTNSSTTDTVAPVLVSSSVSTSGNILITYNENLSSTTAATSRFQVTIEGQLASVSSVTASGRVVTVVTSPVVGAGQSVVFTYSAPSPSNSAASNNAVQDTAGNDALSITVGQVISGSDNLSTLDLTGPTLVSTAVNAAGAAVLTFSETLGATGPSASAFTVTVDGVTLTVTGVTIVGGTVVIVTSPKIEAGKAASIVYNAPSSNTATSNAAIQDAAGNDAAGATFTVTSANNASTYDPTPPASTGSEVNDGGKLVITYSETLATPGPDASQFTVTIDGKTATIVSVEVVDNKIVITTSPLIAGGETVTWAFTDATSGNDAKGIQDAAGNDVGSGTNGSGSVTNGSKVSNVDPVPPTVSGSEVNDGGKVVITFSETLATPGPDSSQFIVTIDGSPVTIVSVEVVDNKVVITTAPLVADGQTVTWKYVDPTTGNDKIAIQDKSGNDLASASIGSGSVKNGSKVTKEAAEVEESPSTTLLSDEVTVDGTTGTATFGDGSQLVVSGKFLKIRFKAGYIGNAGGTVTGTYLVGKKKTKYKCTVAGFGSTKKNPTAKRIYPSKKMGLWFKKKFYTPKTPCVMPPALQKALQTQRVILTVKLKFKRLWPNTAKAIDDKGQPIPPITRVMKLKIGKKPTV